MLARRDVQLISAGGHGDDEGKKIVGEIASRYPENCQLVGWLDRDELTSCLSARLWLSFPARMSPSD